MKLPFSIWKKWKRTDSSALLISLMFTAIMSLMLGSLLMWTANQSALVDHQNEYIATTYAAEAGEERIYAAVDKLLKDNGQAPNQSQMDGFSTSEVPNAQDHIKFGNYTFITPDGQQNKIKAVLLGNSSTQTLASGPYAGLNALITPYQVVSRTHNNQKPIWVAIQSDIQIQHIPIFQFAIFYDTDMEIENGANMTINGRVHSNASGYIAPNASLIFQDKVTFAKNFYNNPAPGDSHQTWWTQPKYNTNPIAQTSALKLPIGSTNYHDIIDLPPAHGNDPIAASRLYNQAGLRITVTDSGVTSQDANGNNVALTSSMLTTSSSLYNYREQKTVKLTELNIGTLLAANKLPSNGILYVADTRSQPETAIRLVNGAALPAQGLTVVSQNPIYIKGDYNTTYDRPSAVFADAINILSANWNDSKSSQSVGNRTACNTTVNSAFLTGIVPTTGNSYSGGVENLPRFLENWSGQTFAYRGSMVVMFASQTATVPWNKSSYNPPTRNWAFDTQFLNATSLPPGTPSVRTIRRANWQLVYY
jgi:hypothetical protein